MNERRHIIKILLGLIAAPYAKGQNTYPFRPIKLVVPYPPGGVTDSLARIMESKIGEILKQSVVVENRGGAGATIGASFVAKSEPDGYTLLITPGGLTFAPNLYSHLNYDITQDFSPITNLVKYPYFLVINGNLPMKSVTDLIKQAKDQPGKLSYASSGIGNIGHLSAEMFCSMAEIKMTHIPYKGDSPAITDLMGGQVDLGFFAPSAILPHVKTGKLKLLAVTGANRYYSHLDVPAIAEAPGMKSFNIVSWLGLVAPAKTPPEIINQLNSIVSKVFSMPDIIERLSGIGFEPAISTPEVFSTFIKNEVVRFSKLAKQIGIKPES
ncbi:MAG: tripartite tricarboxylate transporter substrate binding protein [Betaproteobacteria bacterium]